MGLHDEVNLLRKIRHPNVLQLYEIFESDNNIHLIIEHLNGKELFDYMKYIRDIGFEERPNYKKIIDNFNNELNNL